MTSNATAFFGQISDEPSSLQAADPSLKRVVVYTDGGCDPNPGVGGWAVLLRYGDRVRELSGAEPATTNNRMELTAAIRALEALKQPCVVELHTDSQYVKKGITEWIENWKRNGWKRRDGGKWRPVLNDDLWRLLDQAAQKHVLEWRWVRGHAGNENNERCDELCGHEIERMKKRLASHPPRKAGHP